MKRSLLFLLGIISLVMFESVSHAALKGHETWMGIYLKGKKLGFSYVGLQIGQREIIVNTKVYFTVNSEGIDQSASLTQETHLTRDLKLVRFNLVQDLMGHRQKIIAIVEKDTLLFDIASPSFTKKQSKLLPSYVVPSASYLFNIVHSGLRVGKEGKMFVLVEPLQITKDLTYKILRKEKAELGGQAVDVYVVRHSIGGVESISWITESGVILREELPQGFKSVREPKIYATEFGEEAFPVSHFITLSLIRPQHEIDKARDLKKIKLIISGIQSPQLIPADHRQKVLKIKKLANGRYALTIKIESKFPFVEKTLPFPVSMKDFKYERLLEPSPEVQADHPKIRILSKLLAQGETDSWSLAKVINRWVYDNIDKAFFDSVTAIDALRELRGECQSHTYLFAALSRSAGIPTKIVNGLVYSEDYGGFIYHAWPEVFVGDWRALDPTFGQDKIDATHIKLTESEREDPFEIMRFVGRVRVEFVN